MINFDRRILGWAEMEEDLQRQFQEYIEMKKVPEAEQSEEDDDDSDTEVKVEGGKKSTKKKDKEKIGFRDRKVNTEST